MVNKNDEMSKIDLNLYKNIALNLKSTSPQELTEAVKIIFNGFYKERVLSKVLFNRLIYCLYKNNKESYDILFNKVKNGKNISFGKKRLIIMQKIIKSEEKTN